MSADPNNNLWFLIAKDFGKRLTKEKVCCGMNKKFRRKHCSIGNRRKHNVLSDYFVSAKFSKCSNHTIYPILSNRSKLAHGNVSFSIVGIFGPCLKLLFKVISY